MQHIDQIKEVVLEYQRIQSGIDELEKMTNLLNLRKLELENALRNNRDREKSLIDKIVSETGQVPDYYKIMTELLTLRVTPYIIIGFDYYDCIKKNNKFFMINETADNDVQSLQSLNSFIKIGRAHV